MKVSVPFLLGALAALALPCAGCKTTPEAADTNHPAATTTTKKKPPVPTMPDQSSDVAFQSFLGRLRQAIQAHDVDTIASMMTTNFGYSIDPKREGPGVFDYWDQNNVWPELELVVKGRFVPNEGNYMVAPAEVMSSTETYAGYVAGIHLESGSWKFAYFVKG